MRAIRSALVLASGIAVGIGMGLIAQEPPSPPPIATRLETTPVAPVDPEAALTRLLELNAKRILWGIEARGLLTGEAARRWQGSSMGELPLAPDAVALQGDDRAVGRVIQEVNGERVELYFFLERAPTWKVAAVRSMRDRESLARALESLKEHPDESASGAFTLANLTLSLESDAGLRTWFEAHRAELDGVADSARRGLRVGAIVTFDDRSTNLAVKMRRLALTSAELQVDGNVHFVIGGFGTSTVGLLYSPKETPPAMDPASVLWVEKLAPRWYLLRRA